MRARSVFLLSILGVFVWIAASSAQRSATGTWTPPRTPWGDPDLQGIYTNKDENNTPFERPPEFEGKRLSDFGEKEMALLRKQRQEAAATQASSIGGTAENDTGAGPPHWYEHFDAANAQPWLVIEPEDGRVPPLTQAARDRAAARQAARTGRGPSDSYTDRSLYDRCISRGVPDVMRPIIYGASYDITQAPGYVVIRNEMIHDARVIPLDGRPRLSPAIRQYMGDSRGWWEGNTLVVETTNSATFPFRGGRSRPEIGRRVSRFRLRARRYGETSPKRRSRDGGPRRSRHAGKHSDGCLPSLDARALARSPEPPPAFTPAVARHASNCFAPRDTRPPSRASRQISTDIEAVCTDVRQRIRTDKRQKACTDQRQFLLRRDVNQRTDAGVFQHPQ